MQLDPRTDKAARIPLSSPFAKQDAALPGPALVPAVQSSTGDFWAAAFDPSSDVGTAALIQPGDSAKIQVTIKPTGRVGSTVRVVLYVATPPAVEFPTFSTTGDVLTAIPYAYTVGAPEPAGAAKAAVTTG